jgi:cytidylate kinase
LNNQGYLFYQKYVLIIDNMHKKEIITISGTLGGGKSSTADFVAKKLGFERFSSGDFMRKIALDLGISLNELQVKAEKDNSIDKKIDEEVRKAGSQEKIVIDSRLAFHWIPESFKVYLDLPPEIAKKRILNNLNENALRRQSEDSSSAEEIYKKIISRLESEKKRYKEIYGLDHTDKNNYDLVVDTNKNNLEQVVDIIVSEYKKWADKN